jgi:hypothetical protein
MLEACERLGEKLDNLAALAQGLAEAWQQNRAPSGASPAAGDAAAGAVARGREASSAPGGGEPPGERRPGGGHETGDSQEEKSPAPPGPAAGAGGANGAPEASRLVDMFARAQGGWPAQAADLRQGVEAIMEFLENQAAAAAPGLDLSGILARLQNLEEQQKNLQSQLSVNRWGP